MKSSNLKISVSEYTNPSKKTIVSKALSGIGFDTVEDQDHFLAALIARGVFTDAPVSAKPRFTDHYKGSIDKIREFFTSNITKGRDINSFSYIELLDAANAFAKSNAVNVILGSQLEASKFFLGVMQDYTLNAGGVSQTVNSKFTDREFGKLAARFTSAQQQIFNYFKSSAKTENEVKAFTESANIAIFGTAGKNFKQRLSCLLSILQKSQGINKTHTVHYTSNARYLLSFENDIAVAVISQWFSEELGENATAEIMQSVRQAILKVLECEDDFRRNNNFDKLPAKILEEVNKALKEKCVAPIAKWPGEKHSLIANNDSMRARYQQCEVLQNNVREAREKIDIDIPAITRLSTVTMPTPFDYINIVLQNRFPEVKFVPHQEIFKKIKKNIKGIDVPDIILCNTFDEVRSYQKRGISLDIAISDSDGFMHQRSAAEKFDGTVKQIVYAEMPKNNFANFVMSLSKSLYGPCNALINALKEEQKGILIK